MGISKSSYTWYPASAAENFSSSRYEFIWNEDYSMFRLKPLVWWDDQSYREYQARDNNNDWED